MFYLQDQDVGSKVQVEVKQCKNEEESNLISTNEEDEEPFTETVPSNGNDQREMRTEDSSNATWWDKKLQQNAESELFDSLEDEDDIRFKLPSSSSGTTPAMHTCSI